MSIIFGIIAICFLLHGLEQKRKTGRGYKGDFTMTAIATIFAVLYALA